MSKSTLTSHFHLAIKFKFLLAVLALGFGVLLLGFSLLTMSYKILGQHYGTRTFYLSGPILPDHVFYPILMLADRYQLYRATPQQRFDLHLIYADHRQWASEQLAYRGQKDMAVITAVKGQKYLLSAILAIKDLPDSDQPAAKKRLHASLQNQIQASAKLERSLAGFNTNPIAELRSQQQILLSQLESDLQTPQDQPANR